ncbi:MAG TPA: tyrosine-type recombinase/integrase [Solirubrobacterales bacterium]|nr:tyrosine-type recombinase/integrase [Solirubrobacterales bacterium]
MPTRESKKLAGAAGSTSSRFLDLYEELRMELTDKQLIAEAILVNHAGVGKEETREEYRGFIEHFSQYIQSVHGKTLYTVKRKHVLLFMAHLEQKGGLKPHDSRLSCEWCKVRGYPDGRSGKGYSASTRKGYLSGLRFLYLHFQVEEDLPDINPTAMIPAPRIVHKMGFTPTQDQVKKLFAAPGSPKARLLIRWAFYAPSRNQTFADARWPDIDLKLGKWETVGKGDKVDVWEIAPPLLRELRRFRKWQLEESEKHPGMAAALADPEKAFVLMTRSGRPMTKTQIYKMVRRVGVRAGVGLRKAPSHWDAADGWTSMVTPHAMRRAWATIALNDKKQPLDVVAEVLRHSDTSTTRRHYAPTKSERAQEALTSMVIA